jgi:hypothetical protein
VLLEEAIAFTAAETGFVPRLVEGIADVSDARMQLLDRQLEAELRPVLREHEFVAFNLERAVRTVRAVAAALGLPTFADHLESALGWDNVYAYMDTERLHAGRSQGFHPRHSVAVTATSSLYRCGDGTAG